MILEHTVSGGSPAKADWPPTPQGKKVKRVSKRSRQSNWLMVNQPTYSAEPHEMNFME
jgi:hypothetical protein